MKKVTSGCSNLALLVILLFLCQPSCGTAQDLTLGARSAGMAGISGLSGDIWSLAGNPAQLASLSVLTAATSLENRYLLKETGRYALGTAIPAGGGVLGAGTLFTGYSIYREYSVMLAYGRSFGNRFMAGVGLLYRMQKQGQDGALLHLAGFYAGTAAYFPNGVTVEFSTHNPFGLYLHSEPYARLPGSIRIGVSYQYSPELLLAAELSKSTESAPVFRAGAELSFRDRFFIRGGLSLLPAGYSVGAGFRNKNLRLEIASAYHHYLGYTPALSIQYELDGPE